MLREHLAFVESLLLANSNVASTAGHNLHRGLPREAFVREFLQNHLPINLGIGTGEIIDFESGPRVQRHQNDIILFHHGFPRLNFGGKIDAFLCESVAASLEIKSQLNAKAIKEAVRATLDIKRLKRSPTGNPLDRLYSVLIAYSGPRSMDQVYELLAHEHADCNLVQPELPPAINERILCPCPSLDLIVVLGKGFLYHDTLPIGMLPPDLRAARPDVKWVWVDQERGSLLFLYLFLTHITAVVTGHKVDLTRYLPHLAVDAVKWGTGIPTQPRRRRRPRDQGAGAREP
jgi:hypothetical protein